MSSLSKARFILSFTHEIVIVDRMITRLDIQTIQRKDLSTYRLSEIVIVDRIELGLDLKSI
jgi:hypothetical protein